MFCFWLFLRCGHRGKHRTSSGEIDVQKIKLLTSHKLKVRVLLSNYSGGTPESGGRRIRTSEGINQQIYSLSHLAPLVFPRKKEPVDGFEFIKDLRNQEIHTQVILISGDSTTDLLEQARKFGIGAVLLKPVEKDRLLMTVERTLKQARRTK